MTHIPHKHSLGHTAFSRLFCMCSVILSGIGSPAVAQPAAEQPQRLPLSSVAEVQAIAIEEIDQGVDVRTRGVITNIDLSHAFSIQQDLHGLWVELPPAVRLPEGASLGTEIEVIGTLQRGAYAPLLVAQGLRALGQPGLPEAVPARLNRLFKGADTGVRVTLNGVVQGIREDANRWNLIIESASLRLVARIQKTLWPQRPDELIDAEVSLTGVVGTIRNTRGELLRPALVIARRSDVLIISPAPTEPFEAPEVSLEAVAEFRADPSLGHRLRTSGTVTLVDQSGFLYIQRGLDGLRVEAHTVAGVRLGDNVTAAGFPAIRRLSGCLVEALVRRISTGPPLEPITISPAEILSVNLRARRSGKVATPSTYQGCLVRCTGTLLEIQPPLRGRCRLTLSADEHVFATTLPEDDFPAIRRFRPGSIVAVTGIVDLGMDSGEEIPLVADPTPIRVDILSRSTADVVVLSSPSWWTPYRLATALTAALILVSGSLGWVALLRRHITKQAARLATETQSRHNAEIEYRASLRERSRLAANLHDTVLQSVTGIGFQLKVCRAHHQRVASSAVPRPEKDGSPSRQATATSDPLDVAQRMVDHAMQQLRGTVWALKVLPLEGGTFASALSSLVDRLRVGHDVAIRLDTRAIEDIDDISPLQAGQLLLVVQEAVTNALRHAAPSMVTITPSVTETNSPRSRHLTISVADDGVGFSPDSHPGPAHGHFGLEGLRDRMEQLGGTFTLTSAPGSGTTIVVQVAFSDAEIRS